MTWVYVAATREDRLSKVVGRWADSAASLFGVNAETIKTRDAAELASHTAEHFIYFGHGLRDSLVRRSGIFRNSVVRLFDTDNLPRAKRVIVAVACWSGEQLGRSLTDPPLKVGAYIGWLDDMSVPSPNGPIQDAIVDGLRVLAADGTVRECEETMRRRLFAAHEFFRYRGENHLAKMQASYWATRMFVGGDLDLALS